MMETFLIKRHLPVKKILKNRNLILAERILYLPERRAVSETESAKNSFLMRKIQTELSVESGKSVCMQGIFSDPQKKSFPRLFFNRTFIQRRNGEQVRVRSTF